MYLHKDILVEDMYYVSDKRDALTRVNPEGIDEAYAVLLGDISFDNGIDIGINSLIASSGHPASSYDVRFLSSVPTKGI